MSASLLHFTCDEYDHKSHSKDICMALTGFTKILLEHTISSNYH